MEELPLPKPLLSNTKYKKNLSEILSFNFEEWHFHLNNLASHNNNFNGFWAQNVISFKLTQNEMIAITKCYEQLHNGEDFTDITTKYLINLKEKIDQILLNDSNSYFVRCGPRSPKDARGGIPEISSSKQILDLLIESERIYKDIHLYLENRNDLLERNKYNFFLHLIPWRNFKKENELRCFFFKKNLVAITQYDVQLHFPFQGKETICVSIIQTLMNLYGGALLNSIPYESFVVDVEISTETNSIYIIEFNPYGENGTTGPVHFNWKEDGHILQPKVINQNIYFRFSRHVTAKFEELVIPSNNLEPIQIKPFEKYDVNKLSTFIYKPNQEISDSFLNYL